MLKYSTGYTSHLSNTVFEMQMNLSTENFQLSIPKEIIMRNNTACFWRPGKMIFSIWQETCDLYTKSFRFHCSDTRFNKKCFNLLFFLYYYKLSRDHYNETGTATARELRSVSVQLTWVSVSLVLFLEDTVHCCILTLLQWDRPELLRLNGLTIVSALLQFHF